MGLAQRFQRLLTGRDRSTKMVAVASTDTLDLDKELENKMTTYVFTELVHPDSSLIYSLAYSPETQNLAVTFDDNPDDVTYVYEKVPAEYWASFKKSASKGAFYNRFVKGAFHSKVVDLQDTEMREPVTTPVAKAANSGFVFDVKYVPRSAEVTTTVTVSNYDELDEAIAALDAAEILGVSVQL